MTGMALPFFPAEAINITYAPVRSWCAPCYIITMPLRVLIEIPLLHHHMPIFRIIRSLVSCHTKRNTRSNQSDNKNVNPSHLFTPRNQVRFPSDIELFPFHLSGMGYQVAIFPHSPYRHRPKSAISVSVALSGTSISTVTVIVSSGCYSVIQKISCRNSVCEIDSCPAL